MYANPLRVVSCSIDITSIFNYYDIIRPHDIIVIIIIETRSGSVLSKCTLGGAVDLLANKFMIFISVHMTTLISSIIVHTLACTFQ